MCPMHVKAPLEALVLDAVAIRVLFAGGAGHAGLGDALRARWVGESANSLMPAGQLAGLTAQEAADLLESLASRK